MSGKIRIMIDEIVALRAQGNATIASTTKTKILLKGINPDAYTESSADDPVVMEKVRQIAREFNTPINM